jgi:hypothetical protein
MAKASDALWIAEIEFPNADARAFGKTPEDAVKALIASWTKYAKMAQADPELIIECRDEVTINRCDPGRGYVIGGTDHLWHDVTVNSNDARFDDLFEPKRTKSPSM